MYEPIKLDYELNAFVPLISEETMDIHYNTIYKKAIQKLNEVLIDNNFDFSYPIKDLYKNIEDFPLEARSDIIYNAGAALNHELFFNSISPTNNKEIPEPLNSAILRDFKSKENFDDQAGEQTKNLPGSGFTFLVLNNLKELSIINLSNYDDPIFFNLTPILTLDAWEHSYFLDNYDDKNQYVENIIKITDFKKANENYINAVNYLDKR